MIKRVIFLVESPFNSRDYKRFGVEIFQKSGFNVEVWDFTPILYPDFFHNYMPSDQTNYPKLKLFYSQKEAVDILLNLSNEDFIINLFSYSSKHLQYYRALSKSKADYAVIVSNAIPDTGENAETSTNASLKKLKDSLFYKLRMAWKIFIPHEMWGIIFWRLPFKFFRIKSAKLIIAGGERCLKYKYPIDKKTQILWSHSFDYDLYLSEKELSSNSHSIAIFLDEYLPFHSDFGRLKLKSPVSPDRYYSLLDRFFARVEKELGFKVVIAAHPRSKYENLPDYFSGRECIKGQTVRLIKECSLVLAHRSTALNFANLFQKPVIFLTDSEVMKVPEGPDVPTIAHWFGKKPIYLDEETSQIDWEKELTIDIERYNFYRAAYIKTKNSPDIPSWQILINRLKEIY